VIEDIDVGEGVNPMRGSRQKKKVRGKGARKSPGRGITRGM